MEVVGELRESQLRIDEVMTMNKVKIDESVSEGSTRIIKKSN